MGTSEAEIIMRIRDDMQKSRTLSVVKNGYKGIRCNPSAIPHHSNTYTQYTQQHYNTSSKEHEKIGDEFWTVRSITIDELRPGCVLWAYDDAGCHFGGKKIEPKTCMGDDKYYRTYYLAYN